LDPPRYRSDSAITQITQQGQTGGNTVAAKVVNFAFDNDGRVTSISRYANLGATQLVDTSTYGVNANSLLTSLSEDKGATNFTSYTWSYDHDGRLTGDTVGSGSDSYTYDAASQLTGATHSGGGSESYSYGSTGNRTNTGYSTGTNNQLSSDGTYNYTYDNAGNLTKKTTVSSSAYVTYTWDYRNRLTDVQGYNSSNVLQSHVHYTYDVFDRLIERQVDPTGGGTYATTQAFVYSASNVILVYNGTGTLTDRMLNGPGANNALADENGSGTVSWFLKDREGTTRDVLQYNSSTNTTTDVNQITYGAFGNITAQTNSAYQPLFAYTGQMWDAAAGLYNYHARWYDAATGRFISQDPTAFKAGDPNLYRYVHNRPTNFVDPTGKEGAIADQAPGVVPPTAIDPNGGMTGGPIGCMQAPIPEDLRKLMEVESNIVIAKAKKLPNGKWYIEYTQNGIPISQQAAQDAMARRAQLKNRIRRPSPVVGPAEIGIGREGTEYGGSAGFEWRFGPGAAPGQEGKGIYRPHPKLPKEWHEDPNKYPPGEGEGPSFPESPME
jgi:RHS repeat-associated protein